MTRVSLLIITSSWLVARRAMRLTSLDGDIHIEFRDTGDFLRNARYWGQVRIAVYNYHLIFDDSSSSSTRLRFSPEVSAEATDFCGGAGAAELLGSGACRAPPLFSSKLIRKLIALFLGLAD